MNILSNAIDALDERDQNRTVEAIKFRTYALYKLIIMWINENRLFQGLINYPLIVNRPCCRGIGVSLKG